MTIFFCTTVVLEEDVWQWLAQQCTVLRPLEQCYDSRGYWTGEYRAVVALARDMHTGRLCHLLKYLFMGWIGELTDIVVSHRHVSSVVDLTTSVGTVLQSSALNVEYEGTV